MSRYEDACPIAPAARANRCESCVAANSIPPCVAAFLGGRGAMRTSNVIELRTVQVVEARKAA